MRQCHCIPWDMVRNDTRYDYELCDSGGNGCFWEAMANSLENGGVMESECFCLGDCKSVKYSYSAILKPLTSNECDQTWGTLNLIPVAEHQKALVWSKTMITPKNNVSNWYELEERIMNDYYSKQCEKIKMNDMTTVRLRLEGPTFMTMKRSLRVTFCDKLGSIGGTLGLFSGFSLLAIMELIHWVFKILNSLILSKEITQSA